MMQEILVGVIILAALAFLVKKSIFQILKDLHIDTLMSATAGTGRKPDING